MQEYRKKNHKRLNETGRKWAEKKRKTTPFYNRKAKLRIKYSMTLEQYDHMFEKQNGLCLICNKPQTGKRLAVDHNHKTGAVRGLLCQNCNMALGNVKENITILSKLIIYLKEHNSE